MTPYYQDSAVTIFHGDCREILPTLGTVDAVVTDPQYGLGDRMQGGTWGSALKYSDMRKWDSAPDTDRVMSLLSISPVVVVWGGNNYPLPPSRCWLVWDKQNAVATMADCEFAWVNLDMPAKRFSWPVGRHDFGHPTQKPLPLMVWTLQIIKTPGVILDPFMGCGTTLRAAKDLGRKAIGIEIEERYCEIAAKRMSQEVLPL
jgi:DNA modification methylase